MPASCSAVRTATRSVASRDHLEGLAEVVDLLGAGVEHGEQHVVLGHAVGLGHDHDALAVEQVGHRAGVGHRAAVAGHRDPHLGGGPVAVVGQALDEHGDAVRAVALVHDRLVVGAAGLGAGPALDRAVDVVVGDRGLLGLLDRVVERRVAVGSPPPVRAATSMFLISLANSLPRLASTTAFLCLVVAHLEWPLMRPSPLTVVTISHEVARARARRRSARGGTTWPAGSPAGRRRSYRRPGRPRRGASTSTSGPPPPPTAPG